MCLLSCRWAVLYGCNHIVYKNTPHGLHKVYSQGHFLLVHLLSHSFRVSYFMLLFLDVYICFVCTCTYVLVDTYMTLFYMICIHNYVCILLLLSSQVRRPKKMSRPMEILRKSVLIIHVPVFSPGRFGISADIPY